MQHWTYADVLRIKAKRQNKYHAVRSSSRFKELAGRSFPSIFERDRAEELVLLLRAKEITELVCQPKVMLVDISYRSDFSYKQKNGERVWEEVKGHKGERWTIIKQLWHLFGPGTLYVMQRDYRGKIKTVETIIPVKMQAKIIENRH